MLMGIIKKLIEIGERKRKGRNYPPGTKVCIACRGIITPEQKRTRQLGYHFHLNCWRIQKKAAS